LLKIYLERTQLLHYTMSAEACQEPGGAVHMNDSEKARN